MPGGKGKSIGGKAGSKDSAGKAQKSHSAKAGLQVSRCIFPCCSCSTHVAAISGNPRELVKRLQARNFFPLSHLPLAVAYYLFLVFNAAQIDAFRASWCR